MGITGRERKKAICATVAEDDDMMDAAKYSLCPSVGNWPDWKKLAGMQKELDVLHNQKIDHAYLTSTFPWPGVYGTAFTFKTWSKVALRNLVKAIRW